MKPTASCIDLIKKSESLARVRKDGLVEAYPDPAHGWKVPTIGWGSTGPDIKPDTVWTVSQCENRLMKHVQEVADSVTDALDGAPTTQGEFDALVDFVYNLGIDNFRTSTLLRLHKAGDKTGAAKQFARWNKANSKIMKGLSLRRQRETEIYLGNV